MVLALVLMFTQVQLNIALPLWLQVFVLSAALALNHHYYRASDGDSASFIYQMWLADLCATMMWGIAYRLVPLVGGALGVVLVQWAISYLRAHYRAVLIQRAIPVSWILLLLLLMVLDFLLVVYVYPKFPRSALENLLVPLAYQYTAQTDVPRVDLGPTIGAGDFVFALVLHNLLRAPLCLFPFVFTAAFVVSDYLVLDALCGFPMLVTIVPLELLCACVYWLVSARRAQSTPDIVENNASTIGQH